MVLPAMTGFVQNLVSHMTRKALIPKVDRQPGQLSKFRCKTLNFLGLRAHFAGHMHRITHDNPDHPEFTGQPGKRSEILALVAPPLQRHHRLNGQP